MHLKFTFTRTIDTATVAISGTLTDADATGLTVAVSEDFDQVFVERMERVVCEHVVGVEETVQ